MIEIAIVTIASSLAVMFLALAVASIWCVIKFIKGDYDD